MCYSMYVFTKMISIYLVLLFALTINANTNQVASITRIYSSLAEIVQPLGKLPLEFSDDEWNQIRPDSITLLGENLNITLQTITEKKKSLNGTEVYVRSPTSSDKTTIKLIKGILVDQTNNLVKIQDQSVSGQDTLYFRPPADQIFSLEEPTKSKHYVNFTYTTPLNSKVFLSYLQSNVHWGTQYQLNLNNDQSDLIVMANIQNDGKSPIVIKQAELIGGDINLQQQQGQFHWISGYAKERATAQYAESMMMSSGSSNEATVEEGKELAGLYVFPIKESFTIDAKTNYLLPMFHPTVSVRRYELISKSFTTTTNSGSAQRSYCLISDRYLSNGNCLIREDDRVVGQTSLPNVAAKNKHDFSIGEDADIVYEEKVTLISSKSYNETETKNIYQYEKNSVTETIVLRTQYVYEIHLQVKNFKSRSVNVEYEQKGFHTYQTIKLTKSNKNQFFQDGSSIKSNVTLNANTNESYSYTVQLVL